MNDLHSFKTLSFFDTSNTGLYAGIAAAGTFFNAFLGGYDNMLEALVWFMAIDFCLGFLAAGKAKAIDSHVMFWGGINKFLVLMMVGIGVLLDGVTGMAEPYIRTTIIWFYLGREGVSIVENYGKLGLPLPGLISTLLEQLKTKGDRGAK